MAVDTVELTTVADDVVVCHRGESTYRYDGLVPDTDYMLDGVAARTLPRPGGELLCRFATVNDLHFGEDECGRVDDFTVPAKLEQSLESALAKAVSGTGFRSSAHRLDLMGTCEACSTG